MNAKLTLRLEEELILQAKSFAKASGKSLSQIVADHFRLLSVESKPTTHRWPPVVSSLKGSLRAKDIDEDDYRQYLEDKFL